MAEFVTPVPRSLIGRAYEIINQMSGGAPSDDSDISVRSIMRAIESAYSKVLHEDLRRRLFEGRAINSQMSIPYDCIPLEPAQSKCKPSRGCEVKKVSIPNFAEYNGAPAIFFFGTDGISFTRASSETEAAQVIKPRRFAEVRPAYVVQNKQALVFLPPQYNEICSVSFSGIPEYPYMKDPDCFDIWSEEYPILEYLWEDTKAMVMQMDAEPIIRTTPLKDEVNDGR